MAPALSFVLRRVPTPFAPGTPVYPGAARHGYCLCYVLDDAVAAAATRYLYDVLAPGSYVALSHVTNEGSSSARVKQVQQVTAQSTSPTGVRSRAGIQHLLNGLALVPPGLVWLPEWHPESPDDVLLAQPDRSTALAAVGQRV